MIDPYYSDSEVELYHGDCRNILPQLDQFAIGLLIADPPYGIGLRNHDRGAVTGRWRDNVIQGDDSMEVGQWIASWAASKKLPTIMFANPMRPWPGEWRQFLVWDKGGAVGGGGDTSTCWKQSWELVQVARTPQLTGGRDESVLRFPLRIDMMTLHPAQKPTTLLSYLLTKCSGVKGVLVDPACGSGSSLVAGKKLGWKTIGIELEERYCEAAAERMAQGVLQFE